MKITYDPTVDAAYIDLSEGTVTFGFTYACDPTSVNGQIHLDFDANGRLTGIEVLGASKKLPLELLEKKTT